MPTEVLYAVITALMAAVLALAGLWVKAHDEHRLWTVGKVTEHDRDIALIKSRQEQVLAGIDELKHQFAEHAAEEMRIHRLLITKLNLEVD